jgi:hypothetical protein
MYCAKISSILKANVICPKEKFEATLITYGRLEVGDIPSRLLTTRGIPEDCTITAKINSE